jgi:hypothetical protein
MAVSRPALDRGVIVEVEIEDPPGPCAEVSPGGRPHPAAEIATTGTIECVAISANRDREPAEVQVPLPWQANRPPKTGLTKRCATICNWVFTAPADDVPQVRGRVPDPEMLQIQAILDSRPLPPPDAGA